MQKFNLKDFTKGWFIGNFDPSIIKEECEVAVKRYKTNDYEKSHIHKISDEITVIVSGTVEMNGIQYNEDDIIFIPKGEATDFKCLTDVITVVYKTWSVAGDKYEV